MEFFYLSLFLLFLILLIIFLIYLIVADFFGAPFVPSKSRDAQRMVELAKIKRGNVVYDLGSGDGRLLIAAAMKGAKCIGIEINPILAAYSRGMAKIRGRGRSIKIKTKSFWNEDISSADIVFLYLIPGRMGKIQKKLRSELKSGSRIISNKFKFPNWKEDFEDKDSGIIVYSKR